MQYLTCKFGSVVDEVFQNALNLVQVNCKFVKLTLSISTLYSKGIQNHSCAEAHSWTSTVSATSRVYTKPVKKSDFSRQALAVKVLFRPCMQ